MPLKTNNMTPDLSDAVTAARQLLGWKLVHHTPEGTTAGFIVETEAYTMNDPASHSFVGRTARTAPMFGRAGTLYIYFIYGKHYCVNIVCGPPGVAEAVLIRALEPTEGLTLMQQRRGTQNQRQLTNGPARLAQAMAIGPAHNGELLQQGSVRLEPGIQGSEVTQTTRIGITKATHQPWRFYLTGNAYISKR